MQTEGTTLSSGAREVLALVAYALEQDERGAFGITKQEAAQRIREALAALTTEAR